MLTDPTNLTKTQRQGIIHHVREQAARHLGLAPAIDHSTSGASKPIIDSTDSIELSYGGLFVTFKNPERLRGCMGLFGAEQSFIAALNRATIMALNDPRFVRDPIRGDELDQLTVEVSILTTPQKVDDVSHLIPGRHGVIVTRDDHQGCLLPQVAAERLWDIPTFLSECCRLKAGLPPDAWRNPQTTVLSFEATVICGPFAA